MRSRWITLFLVGSLVFYYVPLMFWQHGWFLWMAQAAGIFFWFSLLLAWGIVSLNSQLFGESFNRLPDPKKKLLALTFDDGPDPEITPKILDLLDQYQAKATFFMIGEKVRQHQKLAQDVLKRGHMVGNHSEHHSWKTNFYLDQKYFKEIQAANESIRDTLGFSPVFYRPPMGLSNPGMFKALEKLQMVSVGWTLTPRDFGNRFPARIAALSKKLKPGTIIALHDQSPENKKKEQVLKNLESLIREAKQQGYHFVKLSEDLLPKTEWVKGVLKQAI